MSKKYIAYGSNLNITQMARRCPTARVVGIGMLKDYQLTFRRVATIVPQAGARTPVGVWEIEDRDEKALDFYEGYPRLYRKETVIVDMRDGTKVEGMVYIMNSGDPDLPNEIYYRVIEEGYSQIGLDEKYLSKALDDTAKRKEAKRKQSKRKVK